MSWITIVGKDVWHATEFVAGVEQTSGVKAIVGDIPTFGPIINTIFGAIVSIEGMLPKGNGALKKSVVTASVTTAHPSIDAAKLSEIIEDVVKALNALETAFKVIQ